LYVARITERAINNKTPGKIYFSREEKYKIK
jgi:hypothetical protein